MEEIEILDDEPKKVSKKKTKKNKKLIIILLVIFILLILGIGYFIYMRYQAQLLLDEENRRIELTNEIESHFSTSVIVNKDTDLIMSGSVIGTIYKDSIINLNDIDIDYNTEYFSIKDLNYNIDYRSVSINDNTNSIISNLSKENRYKNYIVFNKNLVTKDSYSLYYNGIKYYTFNKSDSYSIIINNYEDYYYVEFDNKLFSIHKDDVKEIVDANNSNKKNKSYITTLCYHRVYRTDEKCTDYTICRKQSKFDQDMKYIKDNGYFTLTMEEMLMYLKGNIMIEKGVTITLDDGYLLVGAQEVFEKYDLNGTAFFVTNRTYDYTLFNRKYIDFQSHTHTMHTVNACPRKNSDIGSATQGGGILCKDDEYILNDLSESKKTLGGNVFALAFPFYDHNQRAINLLKQAGFKISFIGSAGVKGKAYPNKTDVYRVPRITVWDNNSLNDIKGFL